MLRKIRSLALKNTRGVVVDIEADVSPGLPYFNIVGLADTSVKEASERVRRAIRNSGFEYPKGRITVNLSPAYIHKKRKSLRLGHSSGHTVGSANNNRRHGEQDIGRGAVL